MRALLKFFAMFLALSMGAPATSELPPPEIYYTVRAGADCMMSASKTGVSRQTFENDESWIADLETDGFRHRTLPISIRFPADEDGISRNCEVQSEMPSEEYQEALVRALEGTFGKPIRQDDSRIWMLQTESGVRGLQFYPDKDSDQPVVRLIGAAF